MIDIGVEVTTPINALVDYKQVSCGAYHTCAIREDNKIRCWGFNENGQLGLGVVDKYSPTLVLTSID